MKSTLLVLAVAVLAAVPAGPSAGATAPAHEPAGKAVLPWMANDFEGALRAARERKVPLFVEAWAPWCHTCRSMRTFVFTDPSLARHAKDFVFLEIDTESPRNSEFRKRYPIEAIPSFFVIDPADRAVKVRWIGSLGVSQLHALLDDAHTGAYSPRPMLARLARADSLFGAANYAAAVPAYRSLLASAAPGWMGYGRSVESMLFALMQTQRYDEGLALAREALPRLRRTSSALNVSAGGLDCAYSLPDTFPGRAGAITDFERSTRSLVTDLSFPAAADDRSGAWIELLSAREALEDSAGAHAVAQEWSDFLDAAAAAAKTPEQRMVFDSHRLSAYLELGQPQRAVPMLLQSERDAPDDYNPPARLAVAYLAMKDYDDALAASDRAMHMAYGPRKLLLYRNRADIYAGRGDVEAARRTLREGLAYLETLPEEQRTAGRRAPLERRLAALSPH